MSSHTRLDTLIKAANIPQEEQKRLDTLHSLNVLDTASEERFVELVRMAKRIFTVPIAMVSLVDENRQWFKSCIGFNATETSRETSFCGHAILDDKVHIIPDAKEDQRFVDNPLVLSGPKIRFYARRSLNVNGYKPGTLCIINHVSRTFGEDNTETLEDLALMVERELSAFQMATVDELTHILNRRGFMSLAQHNLNLCLRQNCPVVLIFFDLDKLKSINDKFVDAAGDTALITFSPLMKNELRGSDLFARLGGDEFAALLSDTTEKKATQVIKRFSLSL